MEKAGAKARHAPARQAAKEGVRQTYGKPMMSQSVLWRIRKLEEGRFGRSDNKERLHGDKTMKAEGEWRGWLVDCRRVVVVLVR